MSNQDSIFILLTNYPDGLSKFLRFLGRWKFSHSSISTSKLDFKFYSFTGKKGFRIEEPIKHPTYKGAVIPCELYKIPVSETLCETVTSLLNAHRDRQSLYKYSYSGLFSMYSHIPVKFKDKYTCSGFVADVLDKSSIPVYKKHISTTKPDDFRKIFRNNLVFHGPLKEMLQKFALNEVVVCESEIN